MGLISERDATLNDALMTGKLFDVISDVYHPEVSLHDPSGEPIVGLDKVIAHEKAFFGSVTEVRGLAVTGAVVDEANGVSYNRQWFDVTFANGHAMNMTEIAVRNWKDDKIIKEEFFYYPGK